MNKRLSLVAIGLLLSASAYSHPKPNKTESYKGQSERTHTDADSRPIVVQVMPAVKTDKEISEEKKREGREQRQKEVEIALAAVVAIAALTQAGIAAWQGHIYRKQYATMTAALEESRTSALAATKSIEALEKIERPFLVIERRGTMKNEFWAKNYGKTSAQILFTNPILSWELPVFDNKCQDWHMPFPPNYGLHYDDPRWEVINVEWIPPGKDCFINRFDPLILRELGDATRAEINAGQRAFRMFSSIKYRGLVSSEIFESRYCCGWANNCTHLAGSRGYNQYT